MIVKTKWGNQNYSVIEEKTNTGNANDNHKYTSFRPLENVKNEKVDTDKDFCSPNRIGILEDEIKESDHDSFDNNNSDSSKDKGKTMLNRNTKTKAPTTVNLVDSILKHVYVNTISKTAKFKKHVVVKHFSVLKYVIQLETIHANYSRKINCSNNL